MPTAASVTTTAPHERTVRIAIVDDHPMIVDGLTTLIHSIPRYKVVHVALNGEEFLHGLKTRPEVDLAIVDLQMKGTDGFEVLERLRTERPEIRTMAFSSGMRPTG